MGLVWRMGFRDVNVQAKEEDMVNGLHLIQISAVVIIWCMKLFVFLWVRLPFQFLNVHYTMQCLFFLLHIPFV